MVNYCLEAKIVAQRSLKKKKDLGSAKTGQGLFFSLDLVTLSRRGYIFIAFIKQKYLS